MPSAKRAPTFYPSEASVRKPDGTLVGGCHRKTFYRISGEEKTNRAGQTLSWRGALGKAAENIAIDLLKKSGRYEANNVKFYDEELNLSGELDIVCQEELDGKLVFYGVEVKSIYGSYAVTQHIKGRGRWRGQPPVVPYPKWEHLMQTMLYVWNFRDQLAGFKILYLARDTGEQKEYNVRLAQFKDDEGNIKHCAEVDGVPNRDLVLEDIHERYRSLLRKLLKAQKTGEPPEREYTLHFTEEQKETLVDRGLMSQTQQDKWDREERKKARGQNYEPVGNWNCSYCDWKDECWPGVT